MAGSHASDGPLSFARPVDALRALAKLARAVRAAHAQLGARRPDCAQQMLRVALGEVNRWVCARRDGATVH